MFCKSSRGGTTAQRYYTTSHFSWRSDDHDVAESTKIAARCGGARETTSARWLLLINRVVLRRRRPTTRFGPVRPSVRPSLRREIIRGFE